MGRYLYAALGVGQQKTGKGECVRNMENKPHIVAFGGGR